MRFLLAVVMSAVMLGSGATAAKAAAPPDEKAAVLRVVQAFFDAMRAGDGSTIRMLYQPKAQFVWGAPSPGGYALSQQSIEAFIPEAERATAPFLERMWSPQVLIDDRVAVVWSRYDFHRGAKFSHNGRDCYVLMKTDAGWKIVSLVFSVEPAVHTENPAGPPK